jgi:hypothetical protein
MRLSDSLTGGWAMDFWCNWCGAHVRVTRSSERQQLGCIACRNLFTVPAEHGVPRLTEDEIVALLSDAPKRIVEDEILWIVAPAADVAARHPHRFPQERSPKTSHTAATRPPRPPGGHPLTRRRKPWPDGRVKP